jgi:hypothetical protein
LQLALVGVRVLAVAVIHLGIEWGIGPQAAGMKLAIERGWLVMHESGTYVIFTPAGAELFA